MKRFVSLFVALAVVGCTTTNVRPVESKSGDTVCVVHNQAVKIDFLQIYTAQLSANGYQPKVIASRSDAQGCTYLSTYFATWGMHWGPYLAHAKIDVYRDDVNVGTALYKAPYASPAKHIHSAPKIQELVDQLFPKQP